MATGKSICSQYSVPYETEMRLAELDAEIELWSEKNNTEKLEICQQELKGLLDNIENGWNFYKALHEEILAYNTCHR